jgi:hypothetical protein
VTERRSGVVVEDEMKGSLYYSYWSILLNDLFYCDSYYFLVCWKWRGTS